VIIEVEGQKGGIERFCAVLPKLAPPLANVTEKEISFHSPAGLGSFIIENSLQAERQGINNFYILSSHKLMPPAMEALLKAKEADIDGFICPGHVSTIIGSRPYEFISRDYGIPCVVAGFEPLDVLQSIQMLVKQVIDQDSNVQIQYTRCVKPEGNTKAQQVLFGVFEVCDASWRGLGMIPNSGLRLKKGYQEFDIERIYELEAEKEERKTGCICGDILRGVATPDSCSLFGNRCTPENSVGPCMVSSEGTCAAYYKYKLKGK
jgi:hydrogenase expression/formation protein HypD